MRCKPNHRNDKQGSYQHKYLGGRRRGGFPQRDMRRDDIGPQTDAQAAEAEKNKPKRQEERAGVACGMSAQAPDPQAKDKYQNGNGHKPVEIRAG